MNKQDMKLYNEKLYLIENLVMIGYESVKVRVSKDGKKISLDFSSKNNSRLCEHNPHFVIMLDEDVNALSKSFNALIALIRVNHYDKREYDNSNYGMAMKDLFEELSERKCNENVIVEFNTRIKEIQKNFYMSKTELNAQKRVTNNLVKNLDGLVDTTQFKPLAEHNEFTAFSNIEKFKRNDALKTSKGASIE